jgi:hypothetical protein
LIKNTRIVVKKELQQGKKQAYHKKTKPDNLKHERIFWAFLLRTV